MQILLEKRQIQWAILDLTKTSLVKKTRKEVSLDSEGVEGGKKVCGKRSSLNLAVKLLFLEILLSKFHYKKLFIGSPMHLGLYSNSV